MGRKVVISVFLKCCAKYLRGGKILHLHSAYIYIQYITGLPAESMHLIAWPHGWIRVAGK
jgi:hypothetical protein